MKTEIEIKLLNKNVRTTAMRQLILGVLYKHQRAMSLYELEKQFENVDRSTIFRTIKTFQDNCIIHKIDDGMGAIKYALCDEGCTCNIDDLHIHFLCTKCGQTTCLKELPVPKLELPDDYNFESANFVIKGTCPNCK